MGGLGKEKETSKRLGLFYRNEYPRRFVLYIEPQQGLL